MTTATNPITVNPFIVLGLHPDGCRRLDSESLMSLIKAHHLKLSAAFHPDRGGNVAKFKVVQWAFGQLNPKTDPDLYEYWCERFFSRRRRSGRAEAESQQLERGKEAVKTVKELWRSIVHPTQFGYSVVHARNIRFLLSDGMETLFQAKIRQSRQWSGPWPNQMAKNFRSIDLDVDAEGLLHKTFLTRINYDPRKETPIVPKPWIEERSPRSSSSYYWKREEKSIDYKDARLIGTLDVRDLSDDKTDQTVTMAALIPGSVCLEHYDWLEKGFPERSFAFALPAIRPWIRHFTYLIGAYWDGHQMRYIVFGQIRKVMSLTDLKEFDFHEPEC